MKPIIMIFYYNLYLQISFNCYYGRTQTYKDLSRPAHAVNIFCFTIRTYEFVGLNLFVYEERSGVYAIYGGLRNANNIDS